MKPTFPNITLPKGFIIQLLDTTEHINTDKQTVKTVYHYQGGVLIDDTKQLLYPLSITITATSKGIKEVYKASTKDNPYGIL